MTEEITRVSYVIKKPCLSAFKIKLQYLHLIMIRLSSFLEQKLCPHYPWHDEQVQMVNSRGLFIILIAM